jgi:hypothetical protein
VVRDAALRYAKHLRKLRDRQRAVYEQFEDPQARRIAQGAKVLRRERSSHVVGRLIFTDHDLRI